MRVELVGTENLQRLLMQGQRNAVPLLASALYEEAEKIMRVSKDLVPVDEGTLMGSGHVQAPNVGATDVEVEFGYGGAAKAYALIQHERMDYNHRTGQAKFLEQPTLEAAIGMGARLARHLGRLFGR